MYQCSRKRGRLHYRPSFLPCSTRGAALSLMYGFINGGFTYFPRLNALVENWHVCGLIPSLSSKSGQGESQLSITSFTSHFLAFNFVCEFKRLLAGGNSAKAFAISSWINLVSLMSSKIKKNRKKTNVHN